MRQLKHHEQKLLKKVDFLQWSSDNNMREATVMRRYHVQKRDDYVKYNRMVGGIKKLVSMITKLHQNDPFRIRTTDQLLQKLYNMGLISTKNSLAACDKITASAFCRRRLPVVMVRLKMSQTLREAVTFIEQGHVRVGSDTINDPAFMVTRNMEDFVTWVDSSKIRRHIQKYNDALDDFDLLGN